MDNIAWVLLVLLALVRLSRADPELNCNASLRLVPGCVYECDCPPETTCQNRHNPQPFCVPSPCIPNCVCRNGYVRNKFKGACVTLAQCDKCPGDGEYFACNGDYDENCDGSCHCLLGYKRDSNNICVSTYVPPPPNTNCPPQLPPGDVALGQPPWGTQGKS